MVAANDHVGTAEILPKHGVQQTFAWTAVAHVKRVAAGHDAVLHEVVLHQRVDALDSDVRRNVARLQFADELMNIQTVAHLDGDLGQVLVRAVHRVPQL